jgi:hypothetical protein
MGSWRKSTYSSGNSDNCVEVATDGGVLVRDTMNRGGATLSVPIAAWSAFVTTIR